MKNILITGAFGNVGTSLLHELLPLKQHHIRCFDLKTPANERRAKQYEGQVEIVWGDIRNQDDVNRAAAGQDVVVHLIALIPPISDRDHAVTRAVNVGGTENVIRALQAADRPVRLIYSSSLALFGKTQHLPPPRTIADPICVTDVYTETKAEAERLIKASGLHWALLRLGAVMPLDNTKNIDPIMFEVPPTDRVEFVHTYDVGFALAQAIDTPEIDGKILLIGGGPHCQMTSRAMYDGILDLFGIKPLPSEAFTQVPYHTDWLDTTESQTLLKFQRHSFDDYRHDVARAMGWKLHAARLVAPLLRRYMLSLSPYYRASKSS